MTHKRFATLLSDWRKENAYTQQEAADKLGISRRSLENWEQERAMPQGFGLGAILTVIGAEARSAGQPARVRKKMRPSPKPKQRRAAPNGPPLETHLL